MATSTGFGEVEQMIQQIAERITRGGSVVTEREQAAARLRRAYEIAHAKALLTADAPNADTRKAQALLATVDQRAAAEEAEIMFRQAQRTLRALERSLEAWRSIGAASRAQSGSWVRGEP